MSDKTIAFIGTGNMSYAIIGGMVKNGFNANNIIATNRNQEKLAKVADDFKSVLSVFPVRDYFLFLSWNWYKQIGENDIRWKRRTFDHLSVDLSPKMQLT